MSQMVMAIYRNILEQVKIIENYKRDLSSHILMIKNNEKRLQMVYDFLSYDMDRHQLLEHVAVVALNNNQVTVLEDLSHLYGKDTENDILATIRREISDTQHLMDTVKKMIKQPLSRSFFERRMAQEITKYVLEQARLYNKNSS
ncbi:MAG: hypothetical protein ACOX0E_00925 [Syntrophomonadaceae bacterium]|jgi:hypothetical protein